MTEIVKFLAQRARREKKGWLNWPIGTPVPLGDIGRTQGGLFQSEGQSTLQDLGIDFETVPDPDPDLVDWQYSQDSGQELFVKAKAGDEGVPSWSSLSGAEIGFSAKFGAQGSYRLLIPELRWTRLSVTPALKASLKAARRDGRLRRKDRIVAGIGLASSYTMLVSTSSKSSIDFTASAEFQNIADADAGFKFKRSVGAVERYVGTTGGMLFLRLVKVRWAGEIGTKIARQKVLDDGDIHLVDVDPSGE